MATPEGEAKSRKEMHKLYKWDNGALLLLKGIPGVFFCVPGRLRA